MSKTLDRIAALLARAERTDNEHESDAFMAKAQELATDAAIDLALARQHTQRAERREFPTVERGIPVGKRRQLGNAHKVALFIEIALTNDLRIDVARGNTHVHLFGFPSDIEVTKALYASLCYQMVEGANTGIKNKVYADERTFRRDDEGILRDAPVNGRTYRISYYSAFVSRVGSRLREAARAAKRARNDSGEEFALVLMDKRDEVNAYHKQASDARGMWSGAALGSSRTGWENGHEGGNNARLSPAKALSGAKGEI